MDNVVSEVPEYLNDRYDVSDIRFTREEPGASWRRDLLKVVDGIFPGGSVFHIFRDTPDQIADLMTILVDGATMIHFDLPRPHAKVPRRAGNTPCEVQIETFDDYRQLAGQEHRKRLDRAVEDAHRFLGKTVKPAADRSR